MSPTTLPTHPVYGTALGLRRDGRPIWSIAGGSGEGGDPPANPTAPPAAPDAPPPADEALGDGGKKALDAERANAKALAKEKAAAEKDRDALAAKLKAIEDANKSEAERTAERLATLEQQAGKAIRYEAAEATGLPLALSSRLVGTTVDELKADAEVLKGLIGSGAPGAGTPAPPPEQKTPKPDHRQGGGSEEVTGSVASGRAAYQERKNRTR